MNRDNLLKLGVDNSLVDTLLSYFEAELKEYIPKMQIQLSWSMMSCVHTWNLILVYS